MSTSLPLVSAVITTHNRLDLLRKAIASVLAQTYPNMECIVVSDNSTDGTDEYCKGQEGITFVAIPASESNGGNHARNVGISHANGEYVAFLDDDDIWHDDKIEKQVRLAQEKNSGCVYCMIRSFNTRLNRYIDVRADHCLEGNLSTAIFRRYFTNTSCLLVRKILLEEVGCFDVEIPKWQEYDLMIRLAQVTPIYYVHERLITYLENGFDKSRISNQRYRLPIAVRRLRKKYKKEIGRLGFLDRFLFEEMIFNETFQSYKYNNQRMAYYATLPLHIASKVIHKYLL